MAQPTANTAVVPAEQLNLKVKSQDGEEVFFKIKSTTQLKKLMDAYCQRQSVILLLSSSMLRMFASYSTENASTRIKHPRISTWRTETRSMW
jgi:hypothetical protein